MCKKDPFQRPTAEKVISMLTEKDGNSKDEKAKKLQMTHKQKSNEWRKRENETEQRIYRMIDIYLISVNNITISYLKGIYFLNFINEIELYMTVYTDFILSVK